LIAAAVGILNFYAYQFFWYWKFWWFDIIMHTLCGLWVGAFTLWFLFVLKRQKRIPYSVKAAFLFAFAGISIIGAGWELFEFSTSAFIFLPRHDPMNTLSDLFFDGVGCLFAVIMFVMLYNKDTEKFS
jgi:hypothetical protein